MPSVSVASTSVRCDPLLLAPRQSQPVQALRHHVFFDSLLGPCFTLRQIPRSPKAEATEGASAMQQGNTEQCFPCTLTTPPAETWRRNCSEA